MCLFENTTGRKATYTLIQETTTYLKLKQKSHGLYRVDYGTSFLPISYPFE